MRFIDAVKIHLKAGNGGAGFVSFFQDWMQKNPQPDGGNGGKGGSIILVASSNLNTLFSFQNKTFIQALNGTNGSKQKRHGKNAEDIYLQVPVGTIVFNADKSQLLFDFTFNGQEFVVVNGGNGGLGNASLTSNVNHAKHSQPGTLGIQKVVWLDLRFLAQVGLIGLPNGGKSSLLNAITNTHVKVGNYEFTTLTPNLGVLKNIHSDQQIIVSDLPGIIERASENRGLGNRFLKHTERCLILLHVVDLSLGYKAVLNNLSLINKELCKYNHYFQTIPQIVVGNKLDLITSQEKLSDFNYLKIDSFPFIKVSALSGEGLNKLKEIIVHQIQNKTNLKTVMEKTLSSGSKTTPIFEYQLEKEIRFYKIGKNTWELSGKVIDDLLKKFDIKNANDLQKLNHKLQTSKISQILKAQGLKKGDLIYISDQEFYWKD